MACTPTWLAHKHCASLTFYFCLQCPFPPPHVRPEASSRDLPPGATVCVCVCVACFLVTEAPGQGRCPHPQGLPCPDCRVTGNVRVDSFLLPCRITLNFPKDSSHPTPLLYCFSCTESTPTPQSIPAKILPHPQTLQSPIPTIKAFYHTPVRKSGLCPRRSWVSWAPPATIPPAPRVQQHTGLSLQVEDSRAGQGPWLPHHWLPHHCRLTAFPS